MNQDLYPKKKNIRWRWDGPEGEHITFLNPASGSICVFNPIAAMIFHMSDGTNTIKDIIDKIVEVYSAPSVELVREDVYSFLDFMIKSGVIMMLDDEKEISSREEQV
ncbi:PqqD family protein [Ruminiclostridium herbifermentans]|uniref:PqqD family protein n=1 Tax=Ruminiclostridium herbifermentans TaxID=2488810 RepID=A0A4V6YE57_9FIRM|nr:PqqD family protein [Ruminiclostridium herbifermentans]QNU67065.1 PqqD family protein [Ruminiclostridium herbifermentans]